MSVAARTMGWQRRMRNTPGPLAAPPGGSGESPNGQLTVELFLGGWIDITALNLVRYANGVQITSGQPDETTAVNPGSCTMTLDNRDGRFCSRNPYGPYYGMLKRNTPLRVSVQSGLARSYRFSGEVAAWPQSLDPTGTDIWVDITAAGRLRRLAQGNKPIKSPIALFWANPSVFDTPAVVYWPCEDGSSATQIASGIGGAPMAISGSPQMASFTGVVTSDALPVLNNAALIGRIPAYTPGSNSLSTSVTTIMCLLAVPSSGETTQVVMSAAGTGTARTWEVYYTSGTGGSIGLRGKDSTGAVIVDTLPIPAQPVDGLNLVVVATVSESSGFGGGSITALDLATDLTASTNAAVGGVTVGRLTSLTVDPGRKLSGTTVGHIAVFPGSQASFAAYEGYSGESAGSRILRLLNFTGINNNVVGSSALGIEPVFMGPQRPLKLLDLIQECVDADMGVLYELPDQIGLGYRTHNTLVNQAPVLTLSYPSGQLTLVPTDQEDDQATRNDWTISRVGGSSAEFQQLTGPLGMADPPSGVGQYEDSKDLNLDDDFNLLNQAGWRVHLGTVDEGRYPQIAVQLAHPSFTSSPTLRQQALAVMPGDRIVVQGPFPTPPNDDISQLVLGVTERIDQFTHQISWNCRPESPWRVAITDDPVRGHAGTDGAQLTTDVSPTFLTLHVATTTPGSPLWTTAAGDFPFDVWVGGEQMTVTNITGASSPQSFTVIRSVNGVVKPQTAGTALRMYQPAIIGF